MVRNRFESETQTSSEKHSTVTAWFTRNDKLDTITCNTPTMNAMALLFCSYFLHFPRLTTVNRLVKSPRHFEKNVV